MCSLNSHLGPTSALGTNSFCWKTDGLTNWQLTGRARDTQNVRPLPGEHPRASGSFPSSPAVPSRRSVNSQRKLPPKTTPWPLTGSFHEKPFCFVDLRAQNVGQLSKHHKRATAQYERAQSHTLVRHSLLPKCNCKFQQRSDSLRLVLCEHRSLAAANGVVILVPVLAATRLVSLAVHHALDRHFTTLPAVSPQGTPASNAHYWVAEFRNHLGNPRLLTNVATFSMTFTQSALRHYTLSLLGGVARYFTLLKTVIPRWRFALLNPAPHPLTNFLSSWLRWHARPTCILHTM